MVIGEELAPFLDPPKANGIDDTTSSLFPDEGFMLPVLSRFGGQPQVSDQGDLFYVFPRFQQSASKVLINPSYATVCHLLCSLSPELLH